jgi:hypothetical protein
VDEAVQVSGRAAGRTQSRSRAGALRSPAMRAALIVAACLGLGAVSLANLPAVLSFDPWAWMAFGREIAHGTLDTVGTSSWKPLTAVLVIPFTALGAQGAQLLWVLFIRAVAFATLALAGRLAWRLAGPGAAVVAVVALALAVGGIRYAGPGTSEWLACGLVLLAAERAEAGSHRAALIAGCGSALLRPEGWLVLGIYGLWLWLRDPRMRVWVAAGAVVVLAGWFIGDWVGSGNPFTGASDADIGAGTVGFSGTLTQCLGMLPPFGGVLAIVGLVLAARERNRFILLLAGAVAIWFVVVVVSAADGFPGGSRFAFPSAGLEAVIAGWAAVRLVALAGERRRPLAWAALGVVALATAIPHAQSVWHERHNVLVLSLDSRELTTALDRAGGARGTERCGAVRDNGNESEIAFRLRRPESLFNKRERLPALLVLRVDRRHGTPYQQLRLVGVPYRLRLLGRADMWRVWAAAAVGGAAGCA